MAEHTILTPEVIATIIGLIVMIGGGTALGIIAALRKYLIKGRDLLTILIDATEDGKLSADEIRKITEWFLKLIREDPEAARALLNSRAGESK
jgi:hypothetical protein